MPEDRTVPSVTIHYKGTDICLDFRCRCSPAAEGHLDGYDADALKCGLCGQVYEIPTEIVLTPVERTEFEPRLIHAETGESA